MARVNYLPQALNDLHGIWRYVYEKSKSVFTADRLVETIDETAAIYASRPELGVVRPEFDERIRCFPVGRYVVHYVEIEDGIEIVQVIHGSRDLPRHWRPPR
ncbi:MAG: type II toxin-antitoxin system RelE/ParE family toxin [Pirellulales bacterium]